MENILKTEKLARVLLDITPVSLQLWDKSLTIIDCNQATANLLKLSDKHEYMERFNDFSPKYQPDGSISREAIIQHIREAFETGYHHIEWTHQTLEGELIPCEISLVRADFNGSQFVATYVRDLREERHIQNELVTALEKAEAAVAAHEAAQITTLAMVETNPHMNVLLNNKFQVINCNPAAVKFMGFESKEDFCAGFTERMSSIIPKF